MKYSAMRRCGIFFSPRSPLSFVIRVSLMIIFVALVILYGGLVPYRDFWNVEKAKYSFSGLTSAGVDILRNAERKLNPFAGRSITKDSNFSPKPVCIFPKLDINDSEIMKFFVKYPRLDCSTDLDWLLIEKGMFIIKDSAHSKHPDIHCDAYPIVKVTDFETEELEPIRDVQNKTRISNDFFRVECSSSDGSKYR